MKYTPKIQHRPVFALIEGLEQRTLLAVNIGINTAQRFQEMDGFGTTLNGTIPQEYEQNYKNLYFQDIGASMVRTNVDFNTLNETKTDDPTIEELNDPIPLSADTYANIAKFNFNTKLAKAAGSMAQAGASMTADQCKLIGTVWSPPGWMKGQERNFWGGYTNPAVYASWPNNGDDNSGGSIIDEPHNLQQFGRYLAAYVKGFEKAYGVPFYSISLQNELAFHEPYSSSVYDPDLFVKVLKAVKAAFNAHNAAHPNDPILTQINGPEDVGVGANGDPWILWRQMSYIDAVRADPTAFAALDTYSIHGFSGYDPTGNPEMWTEYWEGRSLADHPAPVETFWEGIKNDGKKAWMIETSGQPQSWDGAMSIAEVMQDALVYGHQSAWMYWQMGDSDSADPMFTLLDHMVATEKYYAAKHFFKYIRPGSVRVATSVVDPKGVYASAYIHDTQKTLTTELVNTLSVPQTVKLSSDQVGLTSFDVAVQSTSGALWTDLGPINFVNGVATITLPGQSIVTLQGHTATPPPNPNPNPNPDPDPNPNPNPNPDPDPNPNPNPNPDPDPNPNPNPDPDPNPNPNPNPNPDPDPNPNPNPDPNPNPNPNPNPDPDPNPNPNPNPDPNPNPNPDPTPDPNNPDVPPAGTAPDLMATVVGGMKKSALSQSKGKWTLKIKNQGTATFSGTAIINLFASVDATLDPNDPKISAITKKLNLKPGKTATVNLSGVYPSGRGSNGKEYLDYVLLTRVDADGLIPTSSHGPTPPQVRVNNRHVDLAGSWIKPLVVQNGKGKGTLSVQNLGTMPLNTKVNFTIIASEDDVLDENDIIVGKFAQKLNLRGGGNRNVKFTLNNPAALPATSGTLHFFAVIDDGNAVAESNEDNNTAMT